MRPQLSIAPAYTSPDGGRVPPALFVDGILVRGVKMLVADEGGDVLVVLDAAAVAIDPRVRCTPPRAPTPAYSAAFAADRFVIQDSSVTTPGLRLATDGEA